MKYYHGTEKKFDKEISGPPPSINVNKGGGEIGKGFYTTNDPWIAVTWAKGRYGNEASVLEIELGNYSLDSLLIKTKEELIEIWKRLKKAKTTKTHVFGTDIVNAPFATIDSARQYKFESNKAQIELNKCTINKIL